MTRTNKLVVSALALVALLTGACGSDVSVGSGVNTEVSGGDAGPRLGERASPSPSPEPSPEPTSEAPATQAPTEAPTQAPTQEPEPVDTGPAVALDIGINGDQSGTSQFDPSAGSIYAGTCVRWINRDTQARSVEADDGSFASPLLEPDQEWIFCPEEARRYNYHDGTRPYAVAFLEVVPR